MEIIGINRKRADVYTPAQCIVSRNKQQSVGNLAFSADFLGWGGGGEAEGLVRLSGALNKTVRSEKSIYHKHVDSSLLLYCTICMCTSQDYYFFGMDLQKAGMT